MKGGSLVQLMRNVAIDKQEWWIVFDTLREAQKRLEAGGVLASWMDGAVAIAKERVGVRGAE